MNCKIGFAAQFVRKMRKAYPRVIRGRGDYLIGGTSAQHVGNNDPPAFKMRGNEVCVTHREYISDVDLSSTFVNTSYRINPGNSTTFPWLSQIAQNFQQYKILGMVFEYRSLCGEISTQLPLGSVTLATDYNSINPAFSTRQEMLNSEYHVDGKPTEDLIHPIEAAARSTSVETLYVSSTPAVPAGADPRLYDIGQFQLATNGNPSSGVCGELYVSYKVCFYKPILLTTAIYGNYSHLIFDECAVATPFKNQTVKINQLGISAPGAGATITFPAGIGLGPFLVMYQATGTGSVGLSSAPTVSFDANSAANNIYGSPTGQYTNNEFGIQNGTADQITSLCYSFTIVNANIDTVHTFSSGVYPNTVNSGDLFVIALNGNMIPPSG